MLVLTYPYLKNFFCIFRSKQDFEKNSRGRAWFEYQMLISSRLFPATLPNRKLSYFSKFLYDEFQNCIYLIYISKFGQESLLYNSFSREFTMTYFLPIGAIKDRTTKMYPKYFNGNVTIPFVLFYQFFLYDPACKAWLFEKLIFELVASYSFKVTCILVRQVILLRKLGGVISKIYCLVS